MGGENQPKKSPRKDSWWVRADPYYRNTLIYTVPAGVFGSFLGFVYAAMADKNVWFWTPFMGMMSGLVFFFIIYFFLSSGDMVGNALFGLGRPVDPDALEAREQYEIALQCKAREEYPKAVNLFKQYFYSGYDTAQVRTAYFIADILEENLNQHKEAKHWYETVIALSEEDGEIDLTERVFYREGQQALERLAKLSESSERPVRDELVAAKKHLENQEYEMAESLLDNLAKVHPRNPEIDYLKGYSFFNRGNYGLAAARFQNALEKDKNHILAQLLLAMSQEYGNDYLFARDSYKRYIELAENDPEEAERLADARARLEKILKLIAPDFKTMDT